jgi:hypothetical protein
MSAPNGQNNNSFSFNFADPVGASFLQMLQSMMTGEVNNVGVTGVNVQTSQSPFTQIFPALEALLSGK